MAEKGPGIAAGWSAGRPDRGLWERANFLAAAGDPDGTALVLRLGVALYRYWWARSRNQEPFGLLVPVLRRPEARADPALFVMALATAMRPAVLIDMATARQFTEQAVGLARPLGDDRLLTTSLAARCVACFMAGEPEAGRPFGQEAVERARRLGDDVLLGSSLVVYLMTIDPTRSAPLIAEAIACTKRSGDHLVSIFLRGMAGFHALSAGNVPAARAHLEASAQAGQQIGYEDTSVRLTLGGVLRAEGDLDGARSTFEASLRISRRNGNSIGMANAIFGLAVLAGDAGDWDLAAVLHGAAQAFLDPVSNQWHEFAVRERRDSLSQARAHLGDEQLERAYAQGMALSPEKALDLALPRAGPG